MEGLSETITATGFKRGFFSAFGEFLTALQNLKDAGQTPECMDVISAAREAVMATRQDYHDGGKDSHDSWWQTVKSLAEATNALDAIGLDSLAQQVYQLTSGASTILRMMREEEHEHAGH